MGRSITIKKDKELEICDRHRFGFTYITTSQQLQAAVTPKQAMPLLLVKIVPLSCLIQGKMFLVLLLLCYLSMQETLLSLRRSFSVETWQTTLPW